MDGAIELKRNDYAWHMRVVLVHLRDAGFQFTDAWGRALMSLPRPEHEPDKTERAEWGELLQAHRDVWEKAFYELPAPLLDQVDVELALSDLRVELFADAAPRRHGHRRLAA